MTFHKIYWIYPDQDTYSIYIPSSISYSYFMFTKMGRTRRLVPQVWPAAPDVGLPRLQRNFLDAQAGSCARTRSAKMCPRGPASDSDSGKGTCETYLVVCVRRVKASTTERATGACMQ